MSTPFGAFGAQIAFDSTLGRTGGNASSTIRALSSDQMIRCHQIQSNSATMISGNAQEQALNA
jgi:hypothetical protein